MPFYTPKPKSVNFNKPLFMKMSQGQYVVRILDDPKEVDTHWLGWSVKCLGEGCPVCEQNAQIRAENPDTFRSVKGYTPRTTRVMVNVMDRTNVKVCPNCKEETYSLPNGTFPPACEACKSVITSVTPTQSNKIKILTRGATFFEQLNMYDASTLDAKGERLGIHNFDIMIMATGGAKTPPVPAPLPMNKDVVEFDPTKLFVENDAFLSLTRDEMVSMMKGVSLKDIFSARKTESPTSPVKKDEDGLTDEEIQKKINDLF